MPRTPVFRGKVNLLIDGKLPCGLLVQAPSDDRVCFILPYLGRVMIGTTEVEHPAGEPILPSDAERDYWTVTTESVVIRRDGSKYFHFTGLASLLY